MSVTHAYVGTTRCCGATVHICADMPDHREDVQEALREMVNADLIINRVTIEEARKSPRFGESCEVCNQEGEEEEQ